MTNRVFLISKESGDFAFSILTQSDNFEILPLCSAKQKARKVGAPNCEDLDGQFFVVVQGTQHADENIESNFDVHEKDTQN